MKSYIVKSMIQSIARASRLLLRDFYEVQNLQVSVKGPGDFVSAADRRAERIIYEELNLNFDGYSFVMEESGVIEGENKKYYFVIDPLDGTNNFLHGWPFFCISVALVEVNEETGVKDIIASVIDVPYTGQVFWAEKGKGAWLDEGMKDKKYSGQTRRISVSSCKKLDAAMCDVSSLRWNYEKFGAVVMPEDILAKNYVSVRAFGSTALSLAHLAAGNIDICAQIEINSWDVAAGILLVKEAGGKVSDFVGNEVNDVMRANSIIASNGVLHSKVIDLINTDFKG